jgi:hypothetical protein
MPRSLWGWCGSRGLLLAVGISASSRSFIDGYSFFFVSEKAGCGLHDPFGDSLGGAGAAARRRLGLEVEDDRHLKNFVVILFLLRCFVLFDVSFNVRSFLQKKTKFYGVPDWFTLIDQLAVVWTIVYI